jgi:hypothetical protein
MQLIMAAHPAIEASSLRDAVNGLSRQLRFMWKSLAAERRFLAQLGGSEMSAQRPLSRVKRK